MAAGMLSTGAMPNAEVARNLAEIAKALAGREIDPVKDALMLATLDEMVVMAVRIAEASVVLNGYATTFYQLVQSLKGMLTPVVE